jgi:hypothetical protein
MSYASPFTTYDEVFCQLYASGNWDRVVSLAEQESRFENDIINQLPRGKDRDIYSVSLHKAIRKNDVKLVHRLVDKISDPENYKSIRRYHIFIAALLPTIDVLSVLLSFDNEYHTRANHLMLNAAHHQDIELLKFAIKNDANTNEWRGKLFADNLFLFAKREWLETILINGFYGKSNNMSSAQDIFDTIREVYEDKIHELPEGAYLENPDVAELIFKPILISSKKTPMDILATLPAHLTAPFLRLIGS